MQGTKWKDPHPTRQKNHLRGGTTKGTSSSRTPGVHVMFLGLVRQKADVMRLLCHNLMAGITTYLVGSPSNNVH
jgi:hypothetical protein